MEFKIKLRRKMGYIYYKIIILNLLRIYGNFRNLIFIIINRKRRKNNIIPYNQYLFTYNTNLPLSPLPNEIKKIFDKNGIKYRAGAHSIYIHRIEDINKINKQLLYDYPKNIGLKIIFSQIISKDGSVFYTSNKIGPSSSIISVKAVGSVLDKMVVSNILYLHDISPRVYDIIWIKSKEYTLQAMVVKHIDGDFIRGKEGESLINKLINIIKNEDIKILGFGLKSIDFRPPKFNYNIINDSSGNLYYVDIQNFEFKFKNRNILNLFPILNKKIFLTDKNLLKNDKYSIQSISSSIDFRIRTDKQIKIIFNFFKKNEYSIYNKTVLDIGCNNLMLLFNFLNQGIRWCVGLDKPEIIEYLKKLFFYNKFSRINFIGCNPFKSEVHKLLPQKYFDIILYLEMPDNKEFPVWLHNLDFKFFIYEGLPNESIENSIKKITSILPNCIVVYKEKYCIDDTNYYPMIFLQKNDKVN